MILRVESLKDKTSSLKDLLFTVYPETNRGKKKNGELSASFLPQNHSLDNLPLPTALDHPMEYPILNPHQ
jgi:hypothetical protein